MGMSHLKPIWRVLELQCSMHMIFWGCTYCDSGEGASFWGKNCIEAESVWGGGRRETDRGGLEHIVSSRVLHSPQTKDGPKGKGTQKILCLIWPVSNPWLSPQNLNTRSIPRAIRPWNIKVCFVGCLEKSCFEVCLPLGCHTLIRGYLRTYQDW
jgi:hypothetical protein